MELAVAFLGLWALLVFAPDTPTCRILRQAMIELPIKLLSRIGRGHVVAVVVVATAIALLDKELAMAVSMSPEAIAWLASVEIGTLVDAIIGVTLMATTTRFPRITAFLHRARPRARTTRTRRPQRPTPSNDDEHGVRYAAAV